MPDAPKPFRGDSFARTYTRNMYLLMEQLLKNQYALNIMEGIKSHYVEVWNEDPNTFDTYIDAHLRFLTTTSGNAIPANAMPYFEELYDQFVKTLMGNHLNRKRRYQPIVRAFIDFKGSRVGNTSERRLPHVHALMLPHPNYAGRVLELVDEEPVLKGSTVFDRTRKPLVELMTYVMKGSLDGDGAFQAEMSLPPTKGFARADSSMILNTVDRAKGIGVCSGQVQAR
jgi:hypothetical protein